MKALNRDYIHLVVDLALRRTLDNSFHLLSSLLHQVRRHFLKKLKEREFPHSIVPAAQYLADRVYYNLREALELSQALWEWRPVGVLQPSKQPRHMRSHLLRRMYQQIKAPNC